VGADLIVVGAHARSNLSERILGTSADRVLRHATTPVLLIPAASLD
jgi:nucleotide-binding universal stress UspA family protein